MLRVDDVTVRFGGISALRGVTLEAADGLVTGLIGPNGAGKTTLFNVATGLQRPRTGCVVLDGRDVTRLGPGQRSRRGLGRTFQRLEVFGSLSVRDNVLLAAEVERGWRSVSGSGRGSARQVADTLVERTGLGHLADTAAAELPTGSARLLELARALATRPSTLLLDEPGSGLDESETRDLGDLLLEVAAQGTAVLLVEHDVELVMRVCTTVTVLDFGQVLAQGSPAEVQADPRVQDAYLGAAPPAGPPAGRPAGPPVTAAPDREQVML
ncbi:MAG: ABC transporter ATP-binding protein [Mycobacteriales bacterium]|nr:ABC transporter ATP-binding protein [Mycobacteriales bacterium]